MAAKLTALVTFQGLSGIAKDQFENVFHFEDFSVGQSVHDAARATAAQLVEFYVTAAPLQAVGGFLSGVLQSAGSIKVYNVADAKPRPIIYQCQFLPGHAGAGNGMPEHVALCLSFYSLRNIPKHRGRIYLGPLKDTGATGSVIAGGIRPASTLMDALANSGERLRQALPASVTNGMTLQVVPDTGAVPTATNWSIYSVKDNAFRLVTAGWVDDEWDTQRRRRVRASARTSFGL